VTSSAVLPTPRATAIQEQEPAVVTGLAVVLTGGLYVLAIGILVGGILGWHNLPFGSAKMARAYYGLDLEDALRPRIVQTAPAALPH
jgi:hypothetical protein